jgi:hypothetical protein
MSIVFHGRCRGGGAREIPDRDDKRLCCMHIQLLPILLVIFWGDGDYLVQLRLILADLGALLMPRASG